jgi:hypothetical protein
MKVIMDITIAVKGKHIHSILRKEYDTKITPAPGIEIEDSAWKNSKIPTAITCNFHDEYYLINFETVQLDTDTDCKREADMYRLHGWNNP